MEVSENVYIKSVLVLLWSFLSDQFRIKVDSTLPVSIQNFNRHPFLPFPEDRFTEWNIAYKKKKKKKKP